MINRISQILPAFLIASILAAPAMAQQSAKGIVFEDLNGNGAHDAGEPGIADVPISNERDFVLTNREGLFEIAVEDDTIVFLVKPTGYMTSVTSDQIPQFYYMHRPGGSPDFYYKGVAPTGALPDRIEFPLIKQEEPQSFRVVLIADPQPESGQEVEYVRRDVLGELPQAGAAFGITLGDIMFDHLNLFDMYNRAVGRVGIPFYNVIGNHDINYDATTDRNSDDTYNRIFGPTNYSFNYARVHFVALDNIRWKGNPESTGNYEETFEPEQMEWLRKDLEFVPEDYLVVICTHAPIWVATRSNKLTGNLDLLFEVLKDRQHVLALSGHTHYNCQYYFTPEDGWTSDVPFLTHNIVTVCGSWWSGPKDIRGIPIADQRDGSPNGYVIGEFNGNVYTPHYRAAGFGAEYQMRIYPPGAHNAEKPELLLVNVFDGTPDATVELSIDGNAFRPMEFRPQYDPLAESLYSGPLDTGKSWVNPVISHHIWEVELTGEERSRGPHLVTIRYADKLGREYKSSMVY